MRVTLKDKREIEVLDHGANCSRGLDNDHRIHCGMKCPFLKTHDHVPSNVMDRTIPQVYCSLGDITHFFLWNDGAGFFRGHWMSVRTEECCKLDSDPEILKIRNRYAKRYGLGGKHPIVG